MNKQLYITPETDVCILCMNGQVLDGYTILDTSPEKVKQVTEGEINSNSGNVWDDMGMQSNSTLWDEP